MTMIVLLALLAQDRPPTDTKAVQELLQKLFAPKSDKDAVLRELEAHDRITKSEVSSFARYAFTLARKGPVQDGKSPATCTDPESPGKYLLYVPSAAKQGQKVGVFISLHGGGEGSGDASVIQGQFGIPAPGCICVYPTVTKKTNGAWNTEREDRYVMAILEELKRTYNVDTNRVYLAGHSMGGFGTWSIGGHHADLFAALSSMAGGVYQAGCIENLKNTPIWFYHSTDDAKVKPDQDIAAAKRLEELQLKHGPYEFVWKLYTDCGHGLPKDGVRPIFDWMLKKTRNPNPKHLVWQPQRETVRNFFWLRSTRKGGLVEAKIEGDTITLRGATTGLVLYLNDKLVDLKKPVVVRVEDREVFRGVVPHSLVALADSIEAKRDPEMWYSARIVLR